MCDLSLFKNVQTILCLCIVYLTDADNSIVNDEVRRTSPENIEEDGDAGLESVQVVHPSTDSGVNSPVEPSNNDTEETINLGLRLTQRTGFCE